VSCATYFLFKEPLPLLGTGASNRTRGAGFKAQPRLHLLRPLHLWRRAQDSNPARRDLEFHLHSRAPCPKNQNARSLFRAGRRVHLLGFSRRPTSAASP